MANAVGLIQEAIWRDPHWRRLSRSAQCTYVQLLSQKDLDCAGVLPLHISKLAKGCDAVTDADIEADLAELQAERFIFFDLDTDEAFIRSYMRNSNVLKVPNMVKSALRSARLIGSAVIRAELAVELRRTGRPDALEVADFIDPNAEPLRNPSRTLPELTGVGTGKGKGVTFSGNYVGGEPPPDCNLHPENPDKPCRACKRRREWESTQAERNELETRRRRREQRENCPLCNGTNTIEVSDGVVAKCDHWAVTNA